MIESIMYIGIGFLIAGLLVIGVIPLVHGRAVRLTTRRLEALNPVSMGEIHAQKDQLRAEFAMSTRRLEMSIERLKARSASQLAELGKKDDAISRLKFQVGEKAVALLALEAEAKGRTTRPRAGDGCRRLRTPSWPVGRAGTRPCCHASRTRRAHRQFPWQFRCRGKSARRARRRACADRSAQGRDRRLPNRTERAARSAEQQGGAG